ncbi:hypothetical protein F5146DRAFT_976150 [Armillaria mellea]|nr:hypothetical protein F5146DRAFT_976150 [Armillaria mellea]
MAEQRAQAIYIPLMLGLGHGFPLWFPDMDSNLPPSYRVAGTRVGDLGYITDDGGFAYLFNVCAPANDAINEGRVPPNFQPLVVPHPSVRTWQETHPRPSALTTSHVQQTTIELEASTQWSIASGIGGGVSFEFSCSTRTAILVLPDGGELHDSRHPGLLRRYASENAHHWYQYFNDEQGMEIRNGSLYLVTGCDKYPSWGTACFHCPSDARSVSLRFLMAGVGEVGGRISHRWEVQVGVHRRNHQHDASSDPANQTIFLRGFSISVRENPTILQRMFGKSAVELFKSDSSNMKGPPIISSIPYSGENTMGSIVPDTSTRDVGIYRGSAANNDYAYANVSDFYIDSSETYTEGFPKREQVFNPSAKINEYMLQNCPTAHVAITHDEQWMNFRNEGNATIESDGTSAPLDNEFLSRLIKTSDISVSAGCAMLENVTDVQLIAKHPRLLTTVNDWALDIARMESESSLKHSVRSVKLPLQSIGLQSRDTNDILPDSNTGAQEVFQTIYNGRKRRKILRGDDME